MYKRQVSSTAVYLTSRPEGAPSALLHNIKHNEVLHARNVLVTVLTAEVPHIADPERMEIFDLGQSFYRVFIRYGFMEQPLSLIHIFMPAQSWSYSFL